MTTKKPGATGEFPQGKISDDDEGALNVSIHADMATRTVVLQFGKPISWLGLDKATTLRLADLLISRARELS